MSEKIGGAHGERGLGARRLAMTHCQKVCNFPKKEKIKLWGRFLNFEKIAKLSKPQINVN
jgi:hypothetical protein